MRGEYLSLLITTLRSFSSQRSMTSRVPRQINEQPERRKGDANDRSRDLRRRRVTVQLSGLSVLVNNNGIMHGRAVSRARPGGCAGDDRDRSARAIDQMSARRSNYLTSMACRVGIAHRRDEDTAKLM